MRNFLNIKLYKIFDKYKIISNIMCNFEFREIRYYLQDKFVDFIIHIV